MSALGIALATLAAFVISSTFYALVPAAPPAVPGAAPAAASPRPWQLAVEVLRSALVAGLVMGLLASADWAGAADGLLLGLALAVLPLVLLTGSVVWERVPVRTAGTHLADWVVKLAAIGLITGLFA